MLKLKETSALKIAVAGPGRSGTSLLVKLFGGWGLEVPGPESNWHDRANAGLESRLGKNSQFEVDKDPWAYQYLDQISEEQLAEYSVLIVPIRDLHNAASSRLIQERGSRPDSAEHEYWKWDDWGSVPGGSVYPTTIFDQERTLAKGLWKLLEAGSRKGIPILILNFPRFAEDFDYLWNQVSQYLEGRISKIEAEGIYRSIVEPSKVRVRNPSHELSLAEVTGLLEEKYKENRTLTDKIQILEDELEEKVKSLTLELNSQRSRFEEEMAAQKSTFDMELIDKSREFQEELRKIINSQSWKITSPLRKTARAIRSWTQEKPKES